MNELLPAVLEAHGGIKNWERTTRLAATMSLGGPFWAAVGWPDHLSNLTVTVDPHRQHITFAPFTAPDRISVMDVAPERVALTTLDGKVVEERLQPRSSFPPFGPTATWDALQLSYFLSAAVWNYMTTPFVFTQRDVVTQEVAPWTEAGETWRRLAVTFPERIANHNADQVFYYDAAFMLRRVDYSPDVTGKPPVAHYTHEARTFGGFVFPTRRSVHLHDANGVTDRSMAAITIELASVVVE